MRYRFTYTRPSGAVDLDVVADATVTVGELAGALRQRDPGQRASDSGQVTLAVGRPGGHEVLQRTQPLVESPLASGMTVEVRAPSVTAPSAKGPRAMLCVVGGPQMGERFPLSAGSHRIGRSSKMAVRLRDPLISREHARIVVGETIEIIDTNSANGVVIDGAPVGRSVVRTGDRVLLGDTIITVDPIAAPAAPTVTATAAAPTNDFIRSPRLHPRFDPESHPAPDIPQAPQPQRFQLLALTAPILLGAVLYAVTQNPLSLLFVAMSPVFMLGSWAENRWATKRQNRLNRESFDRQLVELTQVLSGRQALECSVRNEEHPSAAAVVDAVRHRNSLLWSYRPDHPNYLTLRLGLGRMDSRVSLKLPASPSANSEMWSELLEFQDRMEFVDDVPVVADLRECGSIGVAGPVDQRDDVARSLVMQAAGLHSPAELTIAACLGVGSSQRWDWLKWLPHTTATNAPITADLLSNGPSSAISLISALEDLVTERAKDALPAGDTASPAVLLVAEGDSPVDPARLVWLADHGPHVGVHVLWSADELQSLPAACRAFAVCGSGSSTQVGFVSEGRSISPIDLDRLALSSAAGTAREMAPITDVGARSDDATDLPSGISYLMLAGPQLAHDASAVCDRWVETDSVSSLRDPARRRVANSLRALIGQAAAEPLAVDLRSQGPHALVAGTTGSGKSELLQTWVLSLATAYSPERVTFLFVDYKGGSAFGECVNLPHSVGLVTDLSPHLVRRALQSLDAELRHREHILNKAKAKDLESMERLGHPETPPSLIIVVDEFAALAHDVPEFVDGVVNVAQRGRSLGLHLILATQRPAGVIKDNLRANTNLRLALRMADEADSQDVLGTSDAAHFDATAPGRAAIRNGPDRLTMFQSGYVGGHTDQGPGRAEISITELSFGASRGWDEPESAISPVTQSDAPTDLQQLVRTITTAAQETAVAPPRKPWLPELPAEIELTSLLPHAARSGDLVFAVGDVPAHQTQPPVAFDPDRDGNLAIIGTGGSGKSTVLRTIAAAAAHDSSGPVHVYALDFGSRGLQMLTPLPQVGAVIPADDPDRVLRILRDLRAMIDDRARRYAHVQADSLTEYRRITGSEHEPRVLLLLDGLAAFRQVHDTAITGNAYDLVAAIAADGRGVGVHLVLTADRLATIPSALGSLIPRRLVLRVADDNDMAMLGVARDLFSIQSPPGRGSLDGTELQVAVLGGQSSVAVQAKAIQDLANSIRSSGADVTAPEVASLPERIRLVDVPPMAGQAVFGVEDQHLGPAIVPPAGLFLVTGPPSAGRTTALVSIARAIQAAKPDTRLLLLAPAHSEVAQRVKWDAVAVDPDSVASIAAELTEHYKGGGSQSWLIVLEDIGDLGDATNETALANLAKTAQRSGQLVIGEGDIQSITRYGALAAAFKAARRGLILQPDQNDGHTLFNTAFPRIRNADFPPGRGLLVQQGRTTKVQVALS